MSACAICGSEKIGLVGPSGINYQFCFDCTEKYFVWACKRCGGINYDTEIPTHQLCWSCSGRNIHAKENNKYHPNFQRFIDHQELIDMSTKKKAKYEDMRPRYERIGDTS